MLITDIIKPKNRLEEWEHFLNRWRAELIPVLSSAKKIEIKIPATCEGFLVQQSTCEKYGHSWFNHSQDTYQKYGTFNNYPPGYKELGDYYDVDETGL